MIKGLKRALASSSDIVALTFFFIALWVSLPTCEYGLFKLNFKSEKRACYYIEPWTSIIYPRYYGLAKLSIRYWHHSQSKFQQ
jgi:hypothetical protein